LHVDCNGDTDRHWPTRGNLCTCYNINYSHGYIIKQCDICLRLFGPNIEYLEIMEKSQEFLKREFIHLLSDTLALLGAEKRLIEDLKASEENPFSLKVIEKIRRYNREQKDKTKHAASLLNTTFSYPSL